MHAAMLSPVGSSSCLTAVVLRILAVTEGDANGTVSKDDITCLEKAVGLALASPRMVSHRGKTMGCDEVLYGRAGLLWALVNLRAHMFDQATTDALVPIFESVPKLVDVLINSGRQGSEVYIKEYGEQTALPLMWEWMEGRFGLGA